MLAGIMLSCENNQQISKEEKKMTKLHNTISINASPEAVWAIVGDMEHCDKWIPGLASVKVEGDWVCS